MPPYKVLQRNTELKKKIKNKKTKTNKRRGWPNFSFVCTINMVQGFFFYLEGHGQLILFLLLQKYSYLNLKHLKYFLTK